MKQLPMIFFGIFTLLAVLSAVFRRARPRPIPAAPAARPLSRGSSLLLSSVFCLTGLAMVYFLCIVPGLEVLAARSWVETPCEIISSEVASHLGQHGTTYSVAIVYSYMAGDRRLTSRRYQFSNASSSGYGGKAKIVDRYPPGSQAVCYVDPANPSSAVIERGVTGDLLIGAALALIFAIIGFIFLVATLRGAAWTVGPSTLRPRQPAAG